VVASAAENVVDEAIAPLSGAVYVANSSSLPQGNSQIEVLSFQRGEGWLPSSSEESAFVTSRMLIGRRLEPAEDRIES